VLCISPQSGSPVWRKLLSSHCLAAPPQNKKGLSPLIALSLSPKFSGFVYAAPMDRLAWKHSRQNTGRPWVGRKGTVVSFPHCEHVVLVSARACVAPPPPPPSARLALHALQRFGSFLNPLSAKNICSPAVNTNSAPHSEHFRTLSWYSMSRSPRTPSGQRGRAHLAPGPVLEPGPVLRERRARIPWACGRSQCTNTQNVSA
jgi:hypothetical protein